MVCFSNYAHRTRTESTSAEQRAILAAALQSFQNTTFCIKVVLSGQLFELTPPPEYQALSYGLHVLKWPRAAERRFLRDVQWMKPPFLVYLARLDTHDGLFLWTWRPILMSCWYLFYFFFIVAYVSISTCMKLKHLAHIDLIELPATT